MQQNITKIATTVGLIPLVIWRSNQWRRGNTYSETSPSIFCKSLTYNTFSRRFSNNNSRTRCTKLVFYDNIWSNFISIVERLHKHDTIWIIRKPPISGRHQKIFHPQLYHLDIPNKFSVDVPLRVYSINHSKVAGAWRNLMGITRNCQSSDATVYAVFSFGLSLNSTCTIQHVVLNAKSCQAIFFWQGEREKYKGSLMV